MTVKCLCDVVKARIIAAYLTGVQQKQLAVFFDTSPRTINRTLIEAGLLTPVAQLKADAYNVMQVLKKHGIDPSKFEQTLATGYRMPIAHEDVVDYLYDLPREDLTELFYNAMMNKAFNTHLAAQTVNYQQEAMADADLPF